MSTSAAKPETGTSLPVEGGSLLSQPILSGPHAIVPATLEVSPGRFDIKKSLEQPSMPSIKKASLDTLPNEVFHLILARFDEDNYEDWKCISHLRKTSKEMADRTTYRVFYSIPLWIGPLSLYRVKELSKNHNLAKHVRKVMVALMYYNDKGLKYEQHESWLDVSKIAQRYPGMDILA
ncbi:uncharacterized protein KY384_008142 [Bacidia gigantensis]|uniref:uncharacterized protein n=1 Tax=Bacidia gigantensis TaxID=2732470 RepID=UPI001D041F08|nr:uncharacterized protein KY384_008142 [Bacidia gigantensis]KAG8526713.1 hypothetical protein KY384_008142 [Bacidia gigantensis]